MEPNLPVAFENSAQDFRPAIKILCCRFRRYQRFPIEVEEDYKKFAPILFPDGKHDLKKLLSALSLQRSVFLIIPLVMAIIRRTNVEINSIWPDFAKLQKATLKCHTRQGLGNHIHNAQCHCIYGLSCESNSYFFHCSISL